MGFPIDRELAGDINNPSLELLDYVLRKQAKNKRRFDKLDHYYNGKHDVVKNNIYFRCIMDLIFILRRI